MKTHCGVQKTWWEFFQKVEQRDMQCSVWQRGEVRQAMQRMAKANARGLRKLGLCYSGEDCCPQWQECQMPGPGTEDSSTRAQDQLLKVTDYRDNQVSYFQREGPID